MKPNEEIIIMEMRHQIRLLQLRMDKRFNKPDLFLFVLASEILLRADTHFDSRDLAIEQIILGLEDADSKLNTRDDSENKEEGEKLNNRSKPETVH